MVRGLRSLRTFASEAVNGLPRPPSLPPGWAPTREFITLALGGATLALYVNSRAEKGIDRLDARMNEGMRDLAQRMERQDTRMAQRMERQETRMDAVASQLTQLQKDMGFLLGMMMRGPGQQGGQEGTGKAPPESLSSGTRSQDLE